MICSFQLTLLISMEVGRIRACCDLVAQYLPTEIRDALVSSYEYVPNLNNTAVQEIKLSSALLPSKSTSKLLWQRQFRGLWLLLLQRRARPHRRKRKKVVSRRGSRLKHRTVLKLSRRPTLPGCQSFPAFSIKQSSCIYSVYA